MLPTVAACILDLLDWTGVNNKIQVNSVSALLKKRREKIEFRSSITSTFIYDEGQYR